MVPHSEDDILALLDAHFQRSGKGLDLGRGDDCALLTPASFPRALTCDVFVEDSHFRRRYFTPYELGWKALAVNISDLAAAGADPESFALGLTLTGKEDSAWLEECFSGMADLAGRWHMSLAGGDLARAGLLHFTITTWGAVRHGDLRRGVAQEGDTIFIYGSAGLARVGLFALEEAQTAEEVQAVRRAYPVACAAHLKPQPCVEFGLAAAELAEKEGLRLGMMDLSDGLARDLPRLLGTKRSGLGAEILLDPESLPEEVRHYAAFKGEDAASFAFRGGEDYAIIGSCPAAAAAKIEGLGAAIIGEVKRGGMMLNNQAWHAAGFDHFG